MSAHNFKIVCNEALLYGDSLKDSMVQPSLRKRRIGELGFR